MYISLRFTSSENESLSMVNMLHCSKANNVLVCLLNSTLWR